MTKITDILWLEEVVEKLHWKHGVEPEEVQEVLDGRFQLRRIEKGKVRGEDLFVALGRSEGGRYLSVFFLLKPAGRALVVSARDMTRQEKRRLRGTR